MYDKLVELRNAATDQLMIRANQDAHGEALHQPRADVLPKRPRREMIDDISPIVSVTVTTENDVNHEMKLLTYANRRGRLSIELSEPNIELLTLKPKKFSASFVDPQVHQEHVTWVRYRHALTTRYYDSTAQKWSSKSMQVRKGEDGLQERVDQVAAVLEEWYRQHHSEPPQ